MKIKFVILLLFISLFSSYLYSQDNKNILIIDNKVHFGKVLNYFPGREGFPERKMSISNDLYVGYKTQGNKAWHNLYDFPELGISFISSYYGNNEEVGFGYGLIPNMTVNFFKIKKQIVKFRIGFGMGYYTKPYDSISNPENIMIGNHFMNMSFYSFIYQHKITNKLFFNAAYSFIHGSNGHYQLPNGGINLPALSIGLKYYFKEVANFPTENKIKLQDKVRINFTAGIGMHEFGGTTGPVGTPKRKIYSTSLFVSKLAKTRSNLFFGISAKYYESYYYFIENDSLLNDKQNLNASIFTIFIGHEFIINRVGFYITGGYNVFRPALTKLYENEKKSVVNILEENTSFKLGFRFFAFKPHDKKRFNPYFGIAIKAKYSNADYPELSCGIVF